MPAYKSKTFSQGNNKKKTTAVVAVAVLALGVTTFAVLRGQGFFSSAFKPKSVGRIVDTCQVTIDGVTEYDVPVVYGAGDYRLLLGKTKVGDVEVSSGIAKVKKKNSLCDGATLYRVSDYGSSEALHYAELSEIYGKKITARSPEAQLKYELNSAGVSVTPSTMTPEQRLSSVMAVAYKWKFGRTTKAKWNNTYSAIASRLQTKSSTIFGTLAPTTTSTLAYVAEVKTFKTVDMYVEALKNRYEAMQGKLLANGVRQIIPLAQGEVRIEPIMVRSIRNKNNTPFLIMFFNSYADGATKPQYVGMAISSTVDKPVFRRTVNRLSIESPVANVIDVRYSITANRRGAYLYVIGTNYEGTSGVKYMRVSQAQLNASHSQSFPFSEQRYTDPRSNALLGQTFCSYSTKSKTCSWTADPTKATVLGESSKNMTLGYKTRTYDDRPSITTNVMVYTKEGKLYARDAVNKALFGNWAVPVELTPSVGRVSAFDNVEMIKNSVLLPTLSTTFKFLGSKEDNGVTKVYLSSAQISIPKDTPTPSETPTPTAIGEAAAEAEAEVTAPADTEPTQLVDSVSPENAPEVAL